MLLAPLFFLAVTFGNTAPNPTEANIPHEELHELQEVSQDQPSLSPYNTMPSLPGPMREIEKDAVQVPAFLSDGKNALASHGLDFFMSYTSDIAGNPVGGINPNGFTYADFFYFGCILDTQKLLGWPSGGSFTISTAQVDGSSLSEKNIGNQFPAQEIFVGQTFYWYQFFYKQQFLNDNVVFKIGRMSSGSDFATSPLYWLYMNGGIDGSPQALLVNEGVSFYPIATWGSSLKLRLTASTTVRCGIYQITEGSLQGMNWNFYPNDGVLIMGQYSWNPVFSSSGDSSPPASEDDEESSPVASEIAQTSKNPIAATSTTKSFQGHYWMGGYFSTSTYNESLSMSQQPNSFGLYWHADQTVYRPDPTTHAGLVLWSVLTLSPQQDIAYMPFQVNGGAVYTGLIPGRVSDNAIFGIAYGSISPNFARTEEQNSGLYPTYELVYELGYRVNLTSSAYVQPDIQWIVNPGCTGTIPNAFVVGAQMGLSF